MVKNHKPWTLLKMIAIMAVILLVAAGCQQAATTAAPTKAPDVVAPTTEAPSLPADVVAMDQVPFYALWMGSGHAKADAAAFTHWDADKPAEIPVTCAGCHSGLGFQDFVGADGSAAGVVDKPAPVGTVITCITCHNNATAKLDSVKFLSDVEIKGVGANAICMSCHQGRATKVQVDAQIEKFKATDLDAVVAPIKDGDKEVAFGFINVHYYAAAITLYGTEVKGGYEYEGKAYDAKNDHEPAYDSCIECHNTHTLEVKVQECAGCHEGVATTEDLKKIRMVSSSSDYDGDGDIAEGMYSEIEGLQKILMGAIQSYGKDVIKAGLVYDPATYPYWLADANNDGAGDTTDTGATGFTSWTPRLLKAAYNYQVSIKDPGAFAHGNKYIIQLLYDSIEDLNAKLPTKVDMSKMQRDDAGHFAGNTEAFRHWDAEGAMVPGSCAKCHAAAGLPQFIKEGANISVPASNGFQCSTCHDGANWPARYAIKEVTFPSGKTVSFGENSDANLCIMCHSGRESGASVAKSVTGLDPDKPSDKIRFRNIHYFAAGVTLFGSDAAGMYEYPNKTYVGKFAHTENMDTCVACHNAHSLAPNPETCKACHNVDDPGLIRMKLTADYDGDGDTKEGLKGEVEGLQTQLLAAIQKYAATKAGKAIAYSPTAYPYWFNDTNANGTLDADEAKSDNAYATWTPNLLFAAYNYQATIKDPGGYVHNATYTMQILIDSIQGVGGDITKLTRP